MPASRMMPTAIRAISWMSRDDGSILGGPKLAALPATRRDYDTALRAAGTDEYKAGFLPYNIMDGWQQLVKDFALLRRDMAAQKYAGKFGMTAAQQQRLCQRAQAVRQLLTLRDLGVWAHFVGDASQPMHVSVHYNGWGEGPNPEGFVTGPGLHAKFESDFVDAHVSEAGCGGRIRPYRDCLAPIRCRPTQAYLSATQAKVCCRSTGWKRPAPLMPPRPKPRPSPSQCLAEAASMLRDLVADAWRASGDAMLGYKTKASVADLEAGRADPELIDCD